MAIKARITRSQRTQFALVALLLLVISSYTINELVKVTCQYLNYIIL